MTNLKTVQLLCFLVAGCGGSAPASSQCTAEQTEVQQEVERCLKALYAGDVDAVLDVTHPMILEKLGGREGARAVMEPGLQRMQELGMQIESFSFPEPPEILQVGTARFAIVPTLTVVSSQGQRVESLNFQMGMREGGAGRWVFVEGSRVNSENVQSFFPDFPRDHKFPEIYRRKL